MTVATADFMIENRPRMDLRRFATVGSLDDGNSTPISRLLLYSKASFEDQLGVLETTSKSCGYDYTDLALLVDGDNVVTALRTWGGTPAPRSCNHLEGRARGLRPGPG